jgi:hypothetical protein
MIKLIGLCVFVSALTALPAGMGADCDREWPRGICDVEDGCAYREMYRHCGNPLMWAKRHRPWTLWRLKLSLIQYYREQLSNVGCFPIASDDPDWRR